MEITIERYTAALAQEWDRFVSNSINGNFLHYRSFYDANPLNSSDDCSFVFRKKGQIITVLPGNLVRENEETHFYSHRRSTYGGFILDKKTGTDEALIITALLLDTLEALGARSVTIQNPFRILYKQLSDEFEYAMWYNHFTVSDRQMEIYVDLSPELETIRSNYANGTKYNIKKANKLVECRHDDLDEIARFWPILEKNLELKYGRKPVHSLDDMQRLIALCGKESFQLHTVYHEEKIVAGCLVFNLNNTVLHAQYIAQDDEHQELRPLSALMDHIIAYGKQHHYRYFNMGTANEGGRTINKGLFHFKESFGGKAVLRETHYLTLPQRNDKD